MSAPPPLERPVESLWRGMHDRLQAFVERRTGSREDAEDIVQDVFLRIHLALAADPRVDRIDAWVYRIARNAVIDGYRRARLLEPLGDAPPGSAPPDEDEDIDELRETLAACLAPFVDQLPEPYAQAVRWTDLEGLTQAEAARRAQISLSGMKSRVQRGRARLRELLEECCRFELDCRGTVVGYEPRCGC